MAQTPWGEIPISDAHVHYFSHRFFSVLAQQKKLECAEELEPLLDWDIPAPDSLALSDRWNEELHRHGAGRACLIASTHGDEESVAQAVAAHPTRFFGYFMVDPLQPDAHGRIRAAGTNRNLHCICLFPSMHKYSMADPRITPILDLASEYRLSMFVHCGALSVDVRRKLGLPSAFDMRFSNPLDVHAIALRYPQIRFIIPHFGAGMFREALMLADLCQNVWLDTSSSNRWMHYEGLDLESVFRRALNLLGAGRLLFGTDSSFFPRGWHAAVYYEQIAALAELEVSAEQARQILNRNLEELHRPRVAVMPAGAAG